MTLRSAAAVLALASALHAADPTPAPSPSSTPDLARAAAASLRARALELAGAFSNDGFKTRDGAWSGRLEPGEPRRIAVHLFAGNQYWFAAAVPETARAPRLTVYDPAGAPVPATAHEGPGLAAVGVTAGATGRYFVQIEAGGPAASDFNLVYLFK